MISRGFCAVLANAVCPLSKVSANQKAGGLNLLNVQMPTLTAQPPNAANTKQTKGYYKSRYYNINAATVDEIIVWVLAAGTIQLQTLFHTYQCHCSSVQVI